MKKSICLVPLLLLSTIIIGGIKGNNENYSINTLTGINISKNANVNKSQSNSTMPVKDEDKAIKIEYEYINNLKEMEVINLNNSSNTSLS